MALFLIISGAFNSYLFLQIIQALPHFTYPFLHNQPCQNSVALSNYSTIPHVPWVDYVSSRWFSFSSLIWSFLYLWCDASRSWMSKVTSAPWLVIPERALTLPPWRESVYWHTGAVGLVGAGNWSPSSFLPPSPCIPQVFSFWLKCLGEHLMQDPLITLSTNFLPFESTVV